VAKWQAIITKVNNGFTVEFKGGDKKDTACYQEKDIAMNEQDNKEHIVEMLYDILEYFGEEGTKHDEKRLRVEWGEQND
jgi:hypothetical protein